ncbi:Bromodomain-containing protein [Stereum hirsutum FP-91666 SS1]|uniref:Bromodomain-containing protein n=1 Tax=Stereum hirsutum (strain FP-91666) TaxID=721885 RepID=UPI000440C696|nr:Bromodomain-containing protein [Stereum hirsutum FP-91666 SS1]EIM92793.1 Bromodomain-containing protein [Stereum hirsutum FP-91666 SS1]
MNALNGQHAIPNVAVDDHPDSPMADSPATPVNTATSVAVKINGDPPHDDEPFAIKIENAKLDASSTRPAVGTPLDPDTIPIHPPNGTPPPSNGELLDDVRMAEQQQTTQETQESQDTPMDEDPAPPNGHVNGNGNGTTPASIPNGSSPTAVDNAHDFPMNEDDDAQPPPAKRARKSSDADMASAHTPATPPPVSPTSSFTGNNAPVIAPVDTTPRVSTLSVHQHKFATSTIRTLKKLKDAGPFKFPVDPLALNIPHYPQVIKEPMDFSTIERKLASSNPVKPDPDPTHARYYNAEEFITDVRRIFQNCLTFNGPDHAITQSGRRVEATFDKQIKQMPANEAPKPPVVKKVATPPPPPPAPAPAPTAASKKPAARRQSVSVPVIRRNEENPTRPKREIHPPPPKDLPYADAPKKARKSSKGSKGTNGAEQLKHCGKILDQLGRKSHHTIVAPFAQPVDPISLGIPDYPKIIKKPMDLSTMRTKLESGQYASADRFRDDFKLMISNCFAYNSDTSPVHKAGVELQKLFEEKWGHMPQPRNETEDDDDDEEDDEEDERARAIAAMESQIETMRNSISALKSSGVSKPAKKEKKKEKHSKSSSASAPIASSSKPSKKENKAPPKKKAGGGGGGKKNAAAAASQPVAEDDTLTFEQKKDLSDAITRIDGQKLERVIQIIHEGVPEIRDSQEEIELEIDLLPASVLTKLYNFVLRPVRQAQAPKKARTGKGTGTGGLKRKSMDEDAEAEKIRRLEAQMALFEQQANGGAASATNGTRPGDAGMVAAGHDSDGSSDSSSDDDSSGSDTE